MQSLYEELDEQVYPDGAQIELSSGYHQVSLRNFVMALAIARLNDLPHAGGLCRKIGADVSLRSVSGYAQFAIARAQ